MRTGVLALRAGGLVAVVAAVLGPGLGAATGAVPEAAAAEGRIGVAASPEVVAPGADLDVRVEGCGADRGAVRSAAFVADVELSGAEGGALRGDTTVRSGTAEGAYALLVDCGGRTHEAAGGVRVSADPPPTPYAAVRAAGVVLRSPRTCRAWPGPARRSTGPGPGTPSSGWSSPPSRPWPSPCAATAAGRPTTPRPPKTTTRTPVAPASSGWTDAWPTVPGGAAGSPASGSTAGARPGAPGPSVPCTATVGCGRPRRAAGGPDARMPSPRAGRAPPRTLRAETRSGTD
ncbi:hypothetical protein [Streptomyces sp. CC210A]|uniref:hypothetical protein n=1 Tax=Streptomyces sp. CC210A TaxID=2898184 RepID=UPI001F3C72B6|nr:hypothetical protein [Streptomyces sp. CC210A]